MRRLLIVSAMLCCALLHATLLRAESELDLDHLIQRLAKDTDFRVRTQAALALGVSKSEQAVEPLCGALDDSSATVRAAAAAALGRLHLGGSDCLEEHLESESSDLVKSALRKALEPVIDTSTQYYVAVGKPSDKSGRPGDAVGKMVRRGMVGAAGKQEGLAVAPRLETASEAKRRLSAHPALKAYFLSPRINPPQYTGGNLVVRIEVALFTYPDKALVADYSVKLTEPGVSEPDSDSENELFEMAAERVIDRFCKIASERH